MKIVALNLTAVHAIAAAPGSLGLAKFLCTFLARLRERIQSLIFDWFARLEIRARPDINLAKAAPSQAPRHSSPVSALAQARSCRWPAYRGHRIALGDNT
ncbi:hypothetical protein [Bordetella genomosp. 5]|uniref:hypothetical protein n=1 Tax=Bordetella genomosp. 5 TaxID=1395608 RepID=UPI00114056ED|nr:hypothetical protein [Bordetella genomosp. 5]